MANTRAIAKVRRIW